MALKSVDLPTFGSPTIPKDSLFIDLNSTSKSDKSEEFSLVYLNYPNYKITKFLCLLLVACHQRLCIDGAQGCTEVYHESSQETGMTESKI